MNSVKHIRNALGWSQQKTAEAAGLNKVTVNHIESGKVNPTVDTLEKLAQAFGVEVADFFPKAQTSLFSANPKVRRTNLRGWEEMYRALIDESRADLATFRQAVEEGNLSAASMAAFCYRLQTSYERGLSLFRDGPDGAVGAEKAAADGVLDALQELGDLASDATHAYATLPESAQVIDISEASPGRIAS